MIFFNQFVFFLPNFPNFSNRQNLPKNPGLMSYAYPTVTGNFSISRFICFQSFSRMNDTQLAACLCFKITHNFFNPGRLTVGRVTHQPRIGLGSKNLPICNHISQFLRRNVIKNYGSYLRARFPVFFRNRLILLLVNLPVFSFPT